MADLEDIEALMRIEEEAQKKEKKDKKEKKKKSRSRSGSQGKNKKKKHSERSGSHQKKKHRSRSRSEKRRQRDQEYEEQRRLREEEERQREEQKRQKEAQEDAAREDLTIMMYCLPSFAGEDEIYKFFKQESNVKIKDIQVIRDSKTKKSKGVAYVEFFNQEGVQQALELNNHIFKIEGKNYPIGEVKIQHSQAEKNRAAAQAKLNKTKQDVTVAKGDGPMKIYVGNLMGDLSSVTDQDLRDIFDSFGEIDYVDIHRDPFTKQCQGYAFIQFKRKEDAKAAIEQMNEQIIGKQKIKVSHVTSNQTQNQNNQNANQNQNATNNQEQDLDEDTRETYLHNQSSRVALMEKLIREDDGIKIGASGIHVGGVEGGSLAQASARNNPLLQKNIIPTSYNPTRYLLFSNMFTLDKVRENPNFLAEIQDDVLTECESFGTVDRIFIDNQSSEGYIFLSYKDINDAIQCQKKQNSRFFYGKQINCNFISDNTFRMRAY